MWADIADGRDDEVEALMHVRVALLHVLHEEGITELVWIVDAVLGARAPCSACHLHELLKHL